MTLGKREAFDFNQLQQPQWANYQLADGVGFEPTVALPLRRFSRPVPSTARPPIHTRNIKYLRWRSGEQSEAGRAICHPIATRGAGECYHDAPMPAKAALIACAALSSDRRNR
jgi:hypothetical protein